MQVLPVLLQTRVFYNLNGVSAALFSWIEGGGTRSGGLVWVGFSDFCGAATGVSMSFCVLIVLGRGFGLVFRGSFLIRDRWPDTGGCFLSFYPVVTLSVTQSS